MSNLCTRKQRSVVPYGAKRLKNWLWVNDTGSWVMQSIKSHDASETDNLWPRKNFPCRSSMQRAAHSPSNKTALPKCKYEYMKFKVITDVRNRSKWHKAQPKYYSKWQSDFTQTMHCLTTGLYIYITLSTKLFPWSYLLFENSDFQNLSDFIQLVLKNIVITDSFSINHFWFHKLSPHFS